MNRKEFLDKMEDHAIIFGLKFKHYKGGIYIGICEATDEATGLAVVIYIAEETGTIWSRPLTEFYGTTDIGVDRFEPVSHIR